MLWLTGLGTFLLSLEKIEKNPTTLWLSKQMKHVHWEGLHLWDLVMPLFLFITGASLVFSLSKRLKTKSKLSVYRHVCIRVLLLWILGMVMQGNLLSLQFEHFRFFSNTLQAIAIGYLGSSLLFLLPKLSLQIIATTSLLILYWILLHLVPVPGIGAGMLTPQENMAAYVDKIILKSHGDGLQYSWILASLTFTVTVMLGCFSGKILQNPKRKPLHKLLLLLLLASILSVTGKISTAIDPCIKPIWSPSFTLLSGGICLFTLAFFYAITDLIGWKKWALPLIHFGSNALFIYLFFSNFFHAQNFTHQFIYGLQRIVGEKYYPSLLSFCAMLLIWGTSYLMYRKKLFIKI